MVLTASVAVIEHLSGDAAAAVARLRGALDLDPTFAMSNYFLGGALRDLGDYAGSAAALRAAMAQSGGTPEMTAALALTLAAQGDSAGARVLHDGLTANAKERHVSQCLLAQIHTALGNTDAAFAALDAAVAERDPELVFLGVRAAYTPLRAHTAFAQIRSRIGV
jgi:tetratricopeptide (TPR) repeat protein